MTRYVRRFATLMLLFGLVATPLLSAAAADVGLVPAVRSPNATMLPFARSERAQAVWASSACFRECGAYCAWGQTSCLGREAQGQCLKLTDDCDRYCQRSCRRSGGPWLPLDF